MAYKILRLPAVIDKTGSNTNDIYNGMKTGTFPKSVPIGKRTVGWLESEIDDWIAAKVRARDAVRRREPLNEGLPADERDQAR